MYTMSGSANVIKHYSQLPLRSMWSMSMINMLLTSYIVFWHWLCQIAHHLLLSDHTFLVAAAHARNPLPSELQHHSLHSNGSLNLHFFSHCFLKTDQLQQSNNNNSSSNNTTTWESVYGAVTMTVIVRVHPVRLMPWLHVK